MLFVIVMDLNVGKKAHLSEDRICLGLIAIPVTENPAENVLLCYCAVYFMHINPMSSTEAAPHLGNF